MFRKSLSKRHLTLLAESNGREIEELQCRLRELEIFLGVEYKGGEYAKVKKTKTTAKKATTKKTTTRKKDTEAGNFIEVKMK